MPDRHVTSPRHEHSQLVAACKLQAVGHWLQSLEAHLMDIMSQVYPEFGQTLESMLWGSAGFVTLGFRVLVQLALQGPG